MWFKIFSANKQKEDSAAQEDHAPETPDMEPVPATYDALMRRSRVHRLDIRIDPDSLPRIALIRKPASDEYLPLKHKLVNAALERLRPYLDYCESLPGMSGNPRVLLENIVRAFLVRIGTCRHRRTIITPTLGDIACTVWTWPAAKPNWPAPGRP